MKFNAVAFLGLLATGAMATGGGHDDEGEQCKAGQIVEFYGPQKCLPHVCWLSPRDFGPLGDGLEKRFDTCKRKCPKKSTVCSKQIKVQTKTTAHHEKFISCKKGPGYSVKVDVGPCPTGNDKECLFVEYKNAGGPKIGHLGIYKHGFLNPKHLKLLNFNSYCSQDKCVVPIHKLPTLLGHDWCDKTYYFGVDGSRCPNPEYPGHPEEPEYPNPPHPTDYPEQPEPTKPCKPTYTKPAYKTPEKRFIFPGFDNIVYFPLKLSCSYKTECKDWCCCPSKADYGW